MRRRRTNRTAIGGAQRAVLYVRVSKGDDQDPKTQLHALRGWAIAQGWSVVSEQCDLITGKPERRHNRNPQGLVQAYDLLRLKQAEILVVWSLDRIVRSMRGLLNFVYDVEKQLGAELHSMQDAWLAQVTGPFRQMMLGFRGGFAEIEGELISKRTIAGLRRTRAEGTRLGRPPAAPIDRALAKHLYEELGSWRAVAREMDVNVVRLIRTVSKTSVQNVDPARRDQAPISAVSKTTVF